jgi:argininosuccinate lyase
MMGNLITLLVVLKGLPLSYNRDLQEDKEPVFDSFKTLAGSLEIMAGMMGGIKFKVENLASAASEGFTTATDLADYITAKGVPFREAHEITGKLVAICVDRKCGLGDLDLEEMRRHCRAIEEDVYDHLETGSSVARRDNPGGTAGNRVQKAMEEAREWLAQIDPD